MPDGTQGDDRIEAAVRSVLSSMSGDLTAREARKISRVILALAQDADAPAADED